MNHPYGWFSLAPPLVAVALAIVTRRILWSLLAGLFCGALLTTGGDPLQATIELCEVHLWPAFIEPYKLRLFVFTMTMGTMIGLLHAAGGMRSFVELFTRWAAGRRSGQLTGWGMGLIVFFDDYSNTLLLGGALRGVFDRLRISREKLAYLVDSTAAPVAGLALISTWVAVEIGYVQQGLNNFEFPPGSQPPTALSIFVACIPYRFYVIQALLFVPIVALLGRDFGPMLQAERKALQARDPAPTKTQSESNSSSPAHQAHWLNAVLPLFVMLSVVLGLLWATGVRNLGANLPVDGSPSDWLREVFGAASSSLALQYGALSGLSVALMLTSVQRLLPANEISAGMLRGALTVLPAVAILWLAGAMSAMTGDRPTPERANDPAFSSDYPHATHRLYTADYLSRLVLGGEGETASGMVNSLLPTGVFVVSAIIAFCTGTSFGTMGLMVPIVVPLACAAAGGTAEAMLDPLPLASLAGVLAGAIFGDHCSPISDTTILSSQACACDHMAHVRTQLPYALLIAVVCVLLGTLPIGWGVSVWLLLPLQTAALIGLLLLLGRKP